MCIVQYYQGPKLVASGMNRALVWRIAKFKILAVDKNSFQSFFWSLIQSRCHVCNDWDGVSHDNDDDDDNNDDDDVNNDKDKRATIIHRETWNQDLFHK